MDQTPLLNSIATFSKSSLRPTVTVVRHLNFDERKVEDLGWRTFQDFTIFGTEQENKEENKEGDIAFSARFVAAIRAIEHEKGEKALFKDPYAAQYAGKNAVSYLKLIQKKDEEILKLPVEQRPYWCPERPYLLIRTKFIDNAIEEFINLIQREEDEKNGTITSQVVILGSGMDSRSFRIDWRSKISNIFEIDRNDVIKWKLELIKQMTDVPSKIPIHYIAADLTLPWIEKIKEKGFDQTKSTLWIVEGLLYYFTSEQAFELMKEIEKNSIKKFNVIN